MIRAIPVDLVCCESYRPIDSDMGGGEGKRPVWCTMVGADTREVGEDDVQGK